MNNLLNLNGSLGLSSNSFVQNTLPNNLVAYWKLDGNSNDSIGSLNGTDTGMSYAVGNGKINQGGAFNGSTSRISLGAAALLNWEYTQPFSVSFWAKWTDTANKAFLGNVGILNHTQKGWMIMTFNGWLYLQVNGVTTELQAQTSGAFNSGAFRHIVATYDGTGTDAGCLFYVDGVSAAKVAGSSSVSNTIISSQNFIIGATLSDSAFYSGSLDEIGIWKRVLTANEASALYNGGLGKLPF